MKKTLFLALICLLAFSFTLYASGDQEVVVEEVEDSTIEGLTEIDRSSWDIGKPGGRFVLSSISDPKSFNNAISQEKPTSDITYRTLSPLIDRNQLTLEWEPRVAERWEVSDDQRTITLYLRKDVVWTDGKKVTARDVVFSYNHIDLREDLESSSRDGLFVNDKPVTVKLIDDYTLSITTDVVYAGLMQISNSYFMPMHVFAPLIGWTEEDGFDYEWTMETVTDEEGNTSEVLKEIKADHIDYTAINSFWGVDTDVTTIVGCGPFTIAEYVPAEKVVLKKNPTYWEKDEAGNQLPYLDEVVILSVDDLDTALAKLQSGEINYYGLRGEDYAVLVNKQDELGITIYNVGADSGTQFLTFNQSLDPEKMDPVKSSWTNNKMFRRALAHLVDRESIINNIAYGFGFPQYSFVPRFSPYYWEGADEAAPKFDVDAAKKILDEIGFIDTDGDGVREDQDGNRISLDMTTNSGNSVREGLSALFAQDAKKAGIEINFQPEDFNVMVRKLLSGADWDIICIGLTGSLDPISGANVYPSNGSLHMNDPNQPEPIRPWEEAVDLAWKVANETLDEEQRKEGWEMIQKIWIEQNPWVYTYNPALMAAYSSKFGNCKNQPLDYYEVRKCLTHIYVK